MKSACLLAMGEAELGSVLRGSGRAKMVWDLVRQGRDPLEQARSVLSQHASQCPALAALSHSSRPSPPDAMGAMQSQLLAPASHDGGHALGEPAMTAKTARLLVDSGLRMPHADIAKRAVGSCGTQKLLVRLHDGFEVETVLIPADAHSKSNRARTTLCVSSQCGCARGCVFCATGKLGLLRNLTSSEILAQLVLGRAVAKASGLPEVTNVVFMGEGEPLNNFKNVAHAVNLMTSAFRLSPRKVTVSTVAPSAAHILRMASLNSAVAWSLHAADDAKRKQLVRE
jgi:hypothetical protein